MENNEQRRQKRRHLIYYLDVRDIDTGESIGRIVDITTGGLLIISNTEYQAETSFNAVITLDSDALGEAQGELEVPIICRWSKSDINPDYFVNGFIFTELTKLKEQRIHRLISSLGFRD